MINKVFLVIAAMAFGSLVGHSVHSAEQGGVKLPEPVNARMETWAIHRAVYKNFTYKLDKEGEDTWDVYDGNFKFVGDCEDFAFTMQRIVGAGSVFPAYLSSEDDVEGTRIVSNHAIFIYAGMVWDMDGKSYNIPRYEQNGRQILFRWGDKTPELK